MDKHLTDKSCEKNLWKYINMKKRVDEFYLMHISRMAVFFSLIENVYKWIKERERASVIIKIDIILYTRKTRLKHNITQKL